MAKTERIQSLNNHSESNGDYVLYWMQASQRVEYNYALEHAIYLANKRNLPVIVLFCLVDTYPEANLRHYTFMVEGLIEVIDALENQGIQMLVRKGTPNDVVVPLSSDAATVVSDRGYLRHQRAWREELAEHIDVPFIQVESDVIVPVETASPKEEYTAGTFRPKLHRHLGDFLEDVVPSQLYKTSGSFSLDTMTKDDIQAFLESSNVDDSVQYADTFHGGRSHAIQHLQLFLHERIDGFDKYRNDPSKEYLSNLSPYLHFGQISSLEIALAAMSTTSLGQESFIEELVVRRELSMNFVHYNPLYDSINCLPNWASTTLEDHRDDSREYVYTEKDFERANTHDPYWNAAQNEMVYTGKMHGYMRMYWGKKIIEWTESPQQAFDIALKLNNKYELDGRDPNGYTGVAWCFGKHDRAWKERPIFGKVRYMNDRGLERKFDITRYVSKIEEIIP